MAYVPFYPQYYGYPQQQQQLLYSNGYSSYMYPMRTQLRPPFFFPQTSPSPAAAYYYANPYQNYQNYGNYRIPQINEKSSSLMMNNLANMTQHKVIIQKKVSQKILSTPSQKASAAQQSSEQVTQDRTVHHNSWWKVYVNKDEQRQDYDENSPSGSYNNDEGGIHRVTRSSDSNNKYQLAPVFDVNMNRKSASNSSTGKQVSASSRNSIRVIKTEDENIITNQPTSEELFHIINNRPKMKPTSFRNELTKQQQKQPQEQQQKQQKRSTSQLDKEIINTDNTEDDNSKTLPVAAEKKHSSKQELNNHCREILSKFVLNETSNEYISGTGIIDYNDLGNDLNKTMQFILREIHSIDAASNFLSLKLTPRQKQDIAALIIDELNKLNIPGDKWGRVCTLVVNTLNQNFKEYFEKKTFFKESAHNNSWLWLVETANSLL